LKVSGQTDIKIKIYVKFLRAKLTVEGFLMALNFGDFRYFGVSALSSMPPPPSNKKRKETEWSISRFALFLIPESYPIARGLKS